MSVVVAPSLLNVSLLQLVSRSATFDELRGDRQGSRCFIWPVQAGSQAAWQTSCCCLLVAMDSGILFQALMLIHGKELVNHWLWKGFKKSFDSLSSM